MFRALGAFAWNRRWLVLIATGVLLVGSLFSLTLAGVLSGGVIHGLESGKADRMIEDVVGRNSDTTVVFLFESKTEAPSSDAFKKSMNDALAPLRTDARVAIVEAPTDVDPRTAATRMNEEGKTAFALVTLKGDLKEALHKWPDVRDLVKSDTLQVTATGRLAFMRDLNVQLEHDLLLAELISIPLALLVLLLVFRTVVAAILPVAVGGLAVVGGIAIVFLLSNVMDVSQYTINVCSLIGLGVAIDYSLFTVSRYREELAAGRDYKEALIRAVDHAGRVVAFSALAVCSGLAGLLFFDGSFLMTMGIGGAIVVALAAIFALTFLPALLAVLGPRINSLKLPLPNLTTREGFWHRLAVGVMKRPIVVLVPTLGVLLFIAAPFLNLRLAASDVRILPENLEARRGFTLLEQQFPDQGDTHFSVVVRFPEGSPFTPERTAQLWELTERISKMDNVRLVQSPVKLDPRLSKEMVVGLFQQPPPEQAPLIEGVKRAFSKDSVVFLQAISAAAPDSTEARNIVKALRETRAVGDGTLVVGGESALDVDTTDYLLNRAPRAVIFVVSMTFIVLMLLLGSVLLPLKAVLMNFLSIGGSFGAMVFIFQEGHSGFLHVQPHALEPVLPIILFCVLFGLSMDYEVLILTRMKEAYERTKNNTLAVGEGIEKTAGLVTSAAAIMVAVFVAFALAKIVLIQAVGVGMAIAVALDATLVRVLLVPATMRLFGDANWWGPKWLLSLQRALHLHHAHGGDVEPVAKTNT